MKSKSRKVDNPSEKTKSGKGLFRELVSTLLIALSIAFIIRTFLFQPFHIPSGSMEPTLIKGDYIITSKYSVGYGKYAAEPLPFPAQKTRWFERELKRGDILVFKPEGNKKVYIKRLIGFPGDQIRMIDGVLHINGTPVEMRFIKDEMQTGKNIFAGRWQETLPNGVSHHIFDEEQKGKGDNTETYTVPAGHYFLMGDNRDNSSDSRKPAGIMQGAGFVPSVNIIGRAEFILASGTEKFSAYKPWTWFQLRGQRFFKRLE